MKHALRLQYSNRHTASLSARESNRVGIGSLGKSERRRPHAFARPHERALDKWTPNPARAASLPSFASCPRPEHSRTPVLPQPTAHCPMQSRFCRHNSWHAVQRPAPRPCLYSRPGTACRPATVEAAFVPDGEDSL
ncbi:hypothetical protein BCV70DRAFT_110252 [Testicularia cyperi]|uniref:Uncharacterized protein n=1 Tax=Testicularia cyperi TaxID=1882483 RepID=A0A317XQP8_9BASI|nr:hypothetical protein BCV70DRAFT_110252 [Testicularia cyperi]